VDASLDHEYSIDVEPLSSHLPISHSVPSEENVASNESVAKGLVPSERISNVDVSSEGTRVSVVDSSRDERQNKSVE
jgi:hypothetical protein